VLLIAVLKLVLIFSQRDKKLMNLVLTLYNTAYTALVDHSKSVRVLIEDLKLIEY
jgi:hypothetical protein